MIKARNFSHVSLRVTDAERAKRFYREVLGLKEVPRPDLPFAGAWYGIGANQLHLISSEKLGAGIDPKAPHFALDIEDFDAAKQTLKQLGIDFLENPNAVGGRQLWLLDPDGNLVELRSDK